MKTAAAVSLVALGMLWGCDKSPTNPSPSQGPSPSPSPGPIAQGLEGTWRATSAEYVSPTNAGMRIEIVSQGSNVTLVLTGTNFTLTVPDPRVPSRVTNGSWISTSDTMTLTPAGVPFSWVFDKNLNGNNLTLAGGRVEFDFDANGSFEQAVLNLALVRQ